MSTTTNLGIVTAYGYAISKGYVGTETQFAEDLAAAASGGAVVGLIGIAYTQRPYEVGEYAIQSGNLYRCIVKISTAEAWTAAHWTEVKVGTELTQIKSDLTATNDALLSLYPTDIATGAIASFSDGAPVPVKDLTVAITPVQSGSGDPSPDNVRPISGWTGCNVTHTGKNLYNRTTREAGYISATGVVTTDGGVSVHSALIPVDEGKTYTFSGSTTTAGGNKRIHGYDENGQWVQQIDYISYAPIGAFSKSFVIPTGIKYIKISMYGHDTDVMVENGSAATSYEPYNGETLTIDWTTPAGTVYGGTLDVVSGVLTVDMARVDLGTLIYSWQNGNKIAYTQLPNMAAPTTSAERAEGIICTAYKPSSTYLVNETMNDKSMLRYNGSIYIRDTSYSSGTAFAEGASGVYLVYELATPQTYQLSALEVSALLGNNNIFADTGDTTVIYRADPTLFINRKINDAISALS